jgi:hypothetical protein
MSGFLEKYNTDEVFLRGLIMGLIKSFNDKLTYIQINDQQEVLEVFVPFFYSMTGDESFLQDFFLEYKECLTDKTVAEGNYDVLPRGIVTMQSSEINTGGLGNKFTRMTYSKESLEGEMKTYSSYTNSIPLNVSFNVAMKIDTMLDAFKMYQAVIPTFYKTYTYSFEYGGFRIPVQVGFPESYEINKQLEFSYASNDYIQFNFSVAVETYFPEKDLSTEKFRGNMMQAGIKMNEVISKKALDSQNREIL